MQSYSSPSSLTSKTMEGIDIFCASPAAPVVHHLNIDEGSSSSTVDLISGGRAIDRHNPIITDASRTSRSLPPSSSQPTISSTPKKHRHKSQKSSSESINENAEKFCSAKEKNYGSRKSYADQSDLINTLKSWSCMNPPPPSSASSRYLMSDTSFLDGLPDFDSAMKSDALETDESQSSDQVVVLKVSLHCKCKGCERKMRKHISRMKGVTSFNIDFATKKVTIIGNVKPLDVLASVSKVRNAQFWSPPTSSSSFPPDGSDQIKKN